MKFFRTITIGVLALGFALGLAAANAYAQQGHSRRGDDHSRDYYGSQYQQRNWRGDYNRAWGRNHDYGRLSWDERRRLQIMRYRMMQHNRYYNNGYNNGYNGGYYNSGRLSWVQRRRLANRRNYFRHNNYDNSHDRRNW